ncbi:hypothetical protein PR202_gb14290 [Eleusine coracana subsp. coracana]|uniref:SET domain-containing protein n=1 Tax=Eleusine coracana subsp. coracana TaxID=191504 RepID=A0AAV5ESS7_ELECO|nr:hypothetical protein PR202_gb14290 [Eleusine coracana subsp. coracana]
MMQLACEYIELLRRRGGWLDDWIVDDDEEYYDELIESKKHDGIRVTSSSKHGKGVCANKDFDEDDLILKDQMLVGAQHSLNKLDCIVCSYCFRFIGSVEFQIGRRLYLHSIGTDNDGAFERHCHGNDVGSSTSCSGATNVNANAVPQEVIMSLMAGDMQLPFTDQFALPSVVACPGGCEGELYCSQSCADSDWDSYHSLLCTGSRTEPSRRSALQKFVEHANGTNDIFLVAAKAITYTMLSDLVVASPVEDYFIYIDDLPDSEKEEVVKVTGQLLDALGEDYSVPCEGTAFFPLQSCMNHSCCPNAKAFKRDEDKDGDAVIVALEPIGKDDEVDNVAGYNINRIDT